MTQSILKYNDNLVPRQKSMALNTAELHSYTRKKRDNFDVLIERRRGTSMNPVTAPNEPKWYYEEYEENDEDPRPIPET